MDRTSINIITTLIILTLGLCATASYFRDQLVDILVKFSAQDAKLWFPK